MKRAVTESGDRWLVESCGDDFLVTRKSDGAQVLLHGEDADLWRKDYGQTDLDELCGKYFN